MDRELLDAFDTLAPHCEVSAALCQEAARGSLDVPTAVSSICTRLGLPQARAADVERALSAGQACRLFEKTTDLTWRARDHALANELAPLLWGARLYRMRVHQDADVVDVVLTKPPSPSQISTQLENMLQNSWGFKDTRQLLPAIAEAARLSFGVMTPFFDGKRSGNYSLAYFVTSFLFFGRAIGNAITI